MIDTIFWDGLAVGPVVKQKQKVNNVLEQSISERDQSDTKQVECFPPFLCGPLTNFRTATCAQRLSEASALTSAMMSQGAHGYSCEFMQQAELSQEARRSHTTSCATSRTCINTDQTSQGNKSTGHKCDNSSCQGQYTSPVTRVNTNQLNASNRKPPQTVRDAQNPVLS